MLDKHEFIKLTFRMARKMKFKVETNRNDQEQIDFGNKKLTVSQLESMHPEILMPGADIAKVIEKFAPGRPCAHKPMKEIIESLNSL